MDEKDWQEIRELRKEFMGTSKGIALGNLIAEKQKLDKIRQVVTEHDNDSMPEDYWYIDRIREILE